MLRGSQPTDLLLVHRADQTSIERLPQIPLPALQELVNLCEALAALGRPRAAGAPPRVRAVALNTARLGEQDARSAVASVSDQLGLPCTDPIRWGGEWLLDAVLNSCGE